MTVSGIPINGISILSDSEYEENYRSLFMSMSEGFGLHELIYDADGSPIDYKFLDVNPAFEKLTGLARKTVIGRTHNECLPADNPTWLKRFSEVVSSGIPQKFEDHSILGRNYQVFAYKLADRKFGVIFSDITEDKRAATHREWLASFPEKNPQLVVEVDAGGRMIYQNPSAQKFCVPAEGENCSNLLVKDLAPYLSYLAAGKTETRVRDIQIDNSWIRQSLLYLPEIQHLRIYSVEITDQVEAKQALEQMNDRLEGLISTRTLELDEAILFAQQKIIEKADSEKASLERERTRFKTLIDLVPAYMVVLTPEHEIVSANRYFRENFGEPLGMKCYQCLFLRTEPCEECESYKPMTSKQEHRWEWEGPNERIYDVYDFPYVVDGEMMILEVGIDITETKQAQKNLDRSNRYNRGLIEINMDALMTVKRDGKISDVNETAVRVSHYSREKLIGTEFLDLFTNKEEASKAFNTVFEEGSIRDFELELFNSKQKITPITLNAIVFKNEDGEYSEFFASLRDMTEFKRKEEELKHLNSDLEKLIAEDLLIHDQLVQSEKLAALGRMLASITHEINNPLQTIKNSLYLIQADLNPEDQLLEYLDIASAETKRISNLVAQLREIYRPSASRTQASFNLISVISDVQSLLRGQLEAGKVKLVLNAPTEGQWDTKGDIDQIKQVFINICTNGIEAMQPDGGRLELTFMQGAPESHEIGVLIRDTGPGISVDYSDRMFEPFQTTKSKGAGLGLAISYEIIQRHHGRLSAHNYDQGAEFAVWLPSFS